MLGQEDQGSLGGAAAAAIQEKTRLLRRGLLLRCLSAFLSKGPARSLSPIGPVLVVEPVNAVALALASSFAAAFVSEALAPSFAAVFALALSRLLLVRAAALARALAAVMLFALAIAACFRAGSACKSGRSRA